MNTPDIKFFRYYKSARSPQHADQTANGSIPVRAYRYCEALRLGCGWGYWLFPPLTFSVVWDGHQIVWKSLESESWTPLQDSVHFPGFPDDWNSNCPDQFKDYCPPFLTSLPESGFLQVSLGVIAQTKPGWLFYMRGAANMMGTSHAIPMSAMVDSEAYAFGPLFMNFRLTQTNIPITFLADVPLVQLSILPRTLLDEKDKKSLPLSDMSDWNSDIWTGYDQTIVDPTKRPNRKFGEYAVRARKSAKGNNDV